MSSSAVFDSVQFNQATFGGQVVGLTGQTAQGIIYAALRKAGVTLGPGRTPSPAQMQDGLDELNRLIGSLNCDRYFIYGMDTVTVPLEAGKTSYTIGLDPSGGSADIAAPRPQAITHANIVNGGSSYELGVLTDQQWAQRLRPTGGLSGIYNDRASPLATIYLDGESSGGTLELVIWHTIPEFQSETDAIFLPPGYADALVLNLACRLAPQFQRQVDADVRQQARESLMRVLSLNAPQPIADTSGMLGCGCGSYNVYTDE